MDKDALSFSGLPDGVGHYDILNLIKKFEREIGISPVLVRHLEYLMSHTRPCDWQAGSRPIVYKTVTAMSADRGVSERQINNRERELHRLGLLTWSDSGNFRRSGYRDKTGQIVSAYGVDLSPLAGLYLELLELEKDHTRFLKLWDISKRSLSTAKRQLRARFDEAASLGVDVEDIRMKLQVLPRVHGRTSLEEIDAFLANVKTWIEDANDLIEAHFTAEISDKQVTGLPTHTRYKQDNIFKEKSSRAEVGSERRPVTSDQPRGDRFCPRCTGAAPRGPKKRSPLGPPLALALRFGAAHDL